MTATYEGFCKHGNHEDDCPECQRDHGHGGQMSDTMQELLERWEREPAYKHLGTYAREYTMELKSALPAHDAEVARKARADAFREIAEEHDDTRAGWCRCGKVLNDYGTDDITWSEHILSIIDTAPPQPMEGKS